MSEKGKAVYLPKKDGWFWIIRSCNHLFYYGPYKTKVIAEIEQDRDFYDHIGKPENE